MHKAPAQQLPGRIHPWIWYAVSVLVFLLSISVFDWLAWQFSSDEVALDETVELFPSYAREVTDEDGDRFWEVRVQGVIFENDHEDSRSIRFHTLQSLRQMAHYFGFDGDMFHSRLSPFLRDFERGKAVVLSLEKYSSDGFERLASDYQTHGLSSSAGLFKGQLRIPAADIKEHETLRVVFIHPATHVTETKDIPRIEERGLSVVSDIDDTIKVTGIGTLSEVLMNTFMREFRSVSGMGPLYSSWHSELADDSDMAFHYASSSPWPMLPALHDWLLSKKEFPLGSFHLKPFRLELFEPWGVDAGAFNLLKDPTQYKIDLISTILQDFPRRRFVLIGDSSEKDPEIYAELMRRNTDQVVCVLIRDVNGLVPPERMRQAFHGVPQTKYYLFHDPSELAGVSAAKMLETHTCSMLAA